MEGAHQRLAEAVTPPSRMGAHGGAHGSAEAAAQLGHASPSVTGLHCVEGAAVAPDPTAVLGRFAGTGENENVE